MAKSKTITLKESGLKLKLKPVNQLKIQRALSSVKMPQRPTYEARTASGRYEIHPMDEEAAKQTPGGELQWQYYQERLTSALQEQNDRVTRVMFTEGVEFDLPDDGWEEDDFFTGLEVPTSLRHKRAHYLMYHIGASDMVQLLGELMKLSGADEETVKIAEESFRAELQDGGQDAESA